MSTRGSGGCVEELVKTISPNGDAERTDLDGNKGDDAIGRFGREPSPARSTRSLASAQQAEDPEG